MATVNFTKLAFSCALKVNTKCLNT